MYFSENRLQRFREGLQGKTELFKKKTVRIIEPSTESGFFAPPVTVEERISPSSV